MAAYKRKIYTGAAILFFCCSLLVYRVPLSIFTRLVTFMVQPSSIEVLHPGVPDIFVKYIGSAVKDFSLSYLLPVFLFLLPSIFLLSAVMPERIEGIITFDLSNKKREKTFLSLLFLFVLLITAVFNFMVFDDGAYTADEFSCLFQADVLRAGKLYAEAPDPSAPFTSTHIVIHDGRWYSKYTLGWPFLLAIGKTFGIPFLVSPLLTAFSVIFLYLIGRELFSVKAGVAAALFAVFSPFVMLHGGTYFTHMAVVFFSLGLLLFLVRSFREDSLWNPLLAGLFAAFLINVRPGDGVMIFLGILPFLALSLVKSRDRKKAFFKTALALLVLSSGIILMLLVNRVQTGDYLKFAFNVYDPAEKWGFGVYGHSPVKGLWNFLFSFFRTSLWTVPFVTSAALYALIRKPKAVILFGGPVLMLSLFYFGYYSMGIVEIGSRFYLAPFVLLLVPAAAGLEEMDRQFKLRENTKVKCFFSSALLLIIAFALLKVDPVIISSVVSEYGTLNKPVKWARITPKVQEPALIFVGTGAGINQPSVFIRNGHNLSKQKRIFVLLSKGKENKKILNSFPGRKVYVLNYDDVAKRFRVDYVPDKKENNN